MMDEQNVARLIAAARGVSRYLHDPLDMSSPLVAENLIGEYSPWQLDQRGLDRATVLKRQADALREQAVNLERQSAAVREFRAALEGAGDVD